MEKFSTLQEKSFALTDVGCMRGILKLECLWNARISKIMLLILTLGNKELKKACKSLIIL